MKILLSCLCTLLLFSSCLKNNEPKSTRVLRINFQEGDLPSLHPHDLMIYLRGLSIAKTLYEGLTRVDAQGVPQLAGAESFEVSSDRLHYTFTLREHLWSDGTPVTAWDYENAWKAALDPLSDCPRADLLYMVKNGEKSKRGSIPPGDVGVRARGPKTLEVDLEYPSPYFLELLSQPICFPIKDPGNHSTLLFNGPFQVGSWSFRDKLTLIVNPNYWNRARTFLDTIEVYMIEDMTTVFSLYEKGQLDWVGMPLCPLSVELAAHLEEQHTLFSKPIDRAFWVMFNTQQPALQSKAIRKALALTVDREAITNHILKGGAPLCKPLPPVLLASKPEVGCLQIEKAHALLQQGLKELGYTKETLPPLVISYSQQAGRKQLAEFLQQQWSSILGLDVQLKSEEWTTLRAHLSNGLFTVSGVFEAAFYKDPLELMERFALLGPTNFSRWIHPEFSKIVEEAKYESDLSRRSALLAQAEEILLEEVPFVPISTDVLLFSHRKGMSGFVFDYVGAIDYSGVQW